MYVTELVDSNDILVISYAKTGGGLVFRINTFALDTFVSNKFYPFDVMFLEHWMRCASYFNDDFATLDGANWNVLFEGFIIELGNYLLHLLAATDWNHARRLNNLDEIATDRALVKNGD